MTIEPDNAYHLLCDQKLQRRLRDNLDQFTVQPHETNGVKQAAVAITIVDAGHGAEIYGLPALEQPSHEAALVLTRRSSRLKNHSGQWAFPGGRMEKGETPEEAALRELQEEVDLELSHDSVLGRLDDFTTRSGFVISPVVVWGGVGTHLTPNPAEVRSIHRIPIAEFLRKDAPILEDNPQGKNPILLMPVGDSWIAAPTAALIYQFREVAVFGKDTRVAHYEQPFFAWK
ncbi:MAG: CoA pyrophosphatase [Deltaproteobacteria bacterium]|nr:CoA pyrophosphatase [Deltaproteobacteria bacterium]MBW2296819.1 CoA pyrophosphatase [Deltaproteobacteria bacterium]MBW2611599.1 CoA pyrophosphatase [Deltaproteobacteria bacterium]MBW2633320.1 CoA pyrophosphatase [Deltaproteobacteria bacterium]MBW2677450.1 CoA pyrophosphatase [Deltaproteobacteria bacterium]